MVLGGYGLNVFVCLSCGGFYTGVTFMGKGNSWQNRQLTNDHVVMTMEKLIHLLSLQTISLGHLDNFCVVTAINPTNGVTTCYYNSSHSIHFNMSTAVSENNLTTASSKK